MTQQHSAEQTQHSDDPSPVFTLRALADALRVRQRAFSQHVAVDEGRCGFFAFLVRAAPRYATMIRHLRADHHHLGLALAVLRLKLRRAVPRQREALLAEYDAIVAAIAAHDDMEREMLRDALEHA